MVEILVVTAIVGLLAVFAFPAINRATAQSRDAACLTKLRQLGTAAKSFAYDFDTHTPDINWWSEQLLPYLSYRPYRDAFWCPASTKSESPLNPSGNLGRDTTGGVIPISYGINGNYPSNNGAVHQGNLGTRGRRLVSLTDQSKVVLFLDAQGGFANLFYDTQSRFSRRHSTSSDPLAMQLNAVFVDGHARKIDMRFETGVRQPWRAMFDGVFQ